MIFIVFTYGLGICFQDLPLMMLLILPMLAPVAFTISK